MTSQVKKEFNMQAPGPNALRFVYGVRKRGLLDVVGELWQEYGDVFQVRIGSRTMLFAIHPDAVERATTTQKKKYDKVASWDPVRKFMIGDGLVASTGELWRRQRKLMAPFFTPKGIRAYAELMISEGVRLQERWQGLAREGTEIEIPEDMMAFTASVILKSMFSTETKESLHQIRKAIETIMTFVNLRVTPLWLPLWVPSPLNRRYLAARALVRRSIAEIIINRRATAPEEWPEDLLSRLMTARDEETGQVMSETLLCDEAITAFVAGHETTARTLTFAWYALAKHPHVAARLHDELDRVLAGRVPSVDELRQLPYTLQVIKEVLRLYPSAPFYSRDAVDADQIAGFDVPLGTMLMLSPYFTHRHPDFWENPEVFDPDRWTRERDGNNRAYHPFGAGPRICIGNNFSLLETHLLLSILAQRFAPRLRQGYEPRWAMQGVLSLANGLPMVIVAR
jgi:cytochrome P450